MTTQPTTKRLPELIRHRRVELDWSQGDLAKRLDVGQQTISRWEAGEAIPRPRTVRKIAMTLGLDAATLLLEAGYLTEEEMPGGTDLDAQARYDRIATKLQALDDRDRATVENMIDMLMRRNVEG